MVYRVFEVRREDADRLEAVLRRDDVSRQSAVVKEARALGLERDTLFLHLEGDEEVLEAAAEVLASFARETPLAEQVHRRLRWEEAAAARGLGSVFGPVEDS